MLISVASLGGDLLSYSTATMFGSATIMSTDGDGTFTPESPDESNLLFYGRNSTAGISPIRIASESDSETDAELFGSVTGFEADPEKVYRLVFTIVTEIDAVGLTAGSAEIGETSKWGPQGLLVDQVNISVEETPN